MRTDKRVQYFEHLGPFIKMDLHFNNTERI